MGVLDILFPKYCVSCRRIGSYLCSNCFSYVSFASRLICVVCNRPAIDGLTHPSCKGKYRIDGAFASLTYEGVVKKLLYTYKYKPFVTGLTETLVSLFYEGIIQQEAFYRVLTDSTIFVPIPLHEAKYRKRGYNQAELLAEGIGKKLQIPTVPLLKRVRQTQSQFGLNRMQRQKNMKDAFALIPKGKGSVAGKTIFLVDDVFTSGTTLSEAASVLKHNGAQAVYGLTLAHGQ